MHKQATHKINNEKVSNGQIGKLIKEALILFIIATAIFLFISLVTYHRSDGGWSHTGYSTDINNAAGNAGAWFSDVLLYIFGYLAYIFPIFITYFAYQCYKLEQFIVSDYKLILIRLSGYILTICAACSIVSLLIFNKSTYLPFSTGGILGDFIGFFILNIFNLAGSMIVLIVFLLIGVTLLSDLSWFNVIEQSSKFIVKCFNNSIRFIVNSFNKIVDKFATNEPLKTNTLTKEKTVLFKQKNQKKLSIEQIIKKSKNKIIKAQANKSVEDLPLSNELPSLSLLNIKKGELNTTISAEKIEAVSREVEQRILEFGIEVKVVDVFPGPVITRFEVQLAPGIKGSKLTAISKDLARSLSVLSVRVVEVIPGKSVVGLEIPNEDREIVLLSEVLNTDQYKNSNALLGLALGQDIAGHPVIVDLAKMPHLLVAGTTGSGKSICINTMLLSLLYKMKPEEVKFILVDPKMLELSVYEDIPHLLTPVVTDMKEAANALRWCVAEMERRYALMADMGVRNISGYNRNLLEKNQRLRNFMDADIPVSNPLPYIVVVIDEYADMMMVVGKKVETLITRIAQKARAAGIHLILATQRPSVDVVTGLIKSNIPTRIAFQVSSRIDSRTVLDQQGAEQLLGQGDMLYLPPGIGTPVRVHGAYISDKEVHSIVKDLKRQGKPQYLDEVLEYSQAGLDNLYSGGSDENNSDDLYDEAVYFIKEAKKVSVSSIQRKFKIGYNRAARIVEEMEQKGVVTSMESNGSREIIS